MSSAPWQNLQINFNIPADKLQEIRGDRNLADLLDKIKVHLFHLLSIRGEITWAGGPEVGTDVCFTAAEHWHLKDGTKGARSRLELDIANEIWEVLGHYVEIKISMTQDTTNTYDKMPYDLLRQRRTGRGSANAT